MLTVRIYYEESQHFAQTFTGIGPIYMGVHYQLGVVIMRSIYIEARQWHDRYAGNSYYSAQVWVDGKWLYTTGMNYGYEYQYEHDASRELARRGLLPGDTENVRRYCRENGIDFYSVRYDAKKRELWKQEEA